MFWRLTCTLSAVVFLYVGFALLVFPHSHIAFLGAPDADGSRIMGARSAPLYGGMAMFFLLAGGFHNADLRRLVSWVATVTFVGLMAVGIWHWIGGHVGHVIWRALVVEGVLAALFAVHLIRR